MAKKSTQVEEQESAPPRNVVIMHDMIGPAHNIFQKGEVIPADRMGHHISDNGVPLWYRWDLDRLVQLGAVEYTEAPATTHEGLQWSTVPEVPQGGRAPKGGERPASDQFDSRLPRGTQVPEGNPEDTDLQQAALEEARRIADEGGAPQT